MFASLSGDAGDNIGLTQQECNTFHNPPLSSGFIPITVNTNCSVKVGDDNPSSGSSISTIDLVVYVVIGVVAGVVILIAVGEIVRRNKRSRHDKHRSSALVESQAGVATRRQAPPPYELTQMTK
jgi:hypothetical protein